jgi:hypothetical protein
MAKSDTYSRARKIFEQMDVGTKISAAELADKVGVASYVERKTVAAFLSQQAKKGRVKKSAAKGKRMYYEKLPPRKRLSPSGGVRSKDASKDTITLGRLGEGIVNYIEKLKERIAKLEQWSVAIKEKLRMYAKQKEEYKRLCQEAEAKVKELSAQQPVAQKTSRLTRLMGD